MDLHRIFAPLRALSLCPLLLLGGCADDQPPAPAIEVVVAPAAKEYFPIYGQYVATTRASLDVEVRARVSGFVEAREFTEGSLVKEGELLYRIDNRPYLAKVNRLKAQLESAEAAYAKTQRDVKRLQPLYQQDAASQLDLDNATSSMEQAAAAVSAAKAELREAELELEYTEVRAPISGLVGESRVDIGALVGAGGESLLTTVKQIDPMFVQFHMSALDYLNARRSKDSWKARNQAEQSGKSVEGYVRITLPDDSEYRYWGDINFTDPQVNPQTGTFRVRAQLPNPDRELLPGQYTRATLELDSIVDAVVIREKSIQIEQGGSYVMVAMPDHTAERRFVVLGPSYRGNVVVTSGLEAGEMVIVEGMHKVQHGQAIAPLTEAQYQQRLDKEEAARKARIEQLNAEAQS